MFFESSCFKVDVATVVLGNRVKAFMCILQIKSGKSTGIDFIGIKACFWMVCYNLFRFFPKNMIMRLNLLNQQALETLGVNKQINSNVNIILLHTYKM